MSPAVKQNDERESAEVVAVARRRKFTAGYKRRIVREADACSNPGAIGALLRREGLYSSHLSKWRQEIESIEVAALQSKPRGTKVGDVAAVVFGHGIMHPFAARRAPTAARHRDIQTGFIDKLHSLEWIIGDLASVFLTRLLYLRRVSLCGMKGLFFRGSPSWFKTLDIVGTLTLISVDAANRSTNSSKVRSDCSSTHCRIRSRPVASTCALGPRRQCALRAITSLVSRYKLSRLSTNERLTPKNCATSRCDSVPRSQARTIFQRKSTE
jgi:transposase-like protein